MISIFDALQGSVCEMLTLWPRDRGILVSMLPERGNFGPGVSRGDVCRPGRVCLASGCKAETPASRTKGGAKCPPLCVCAV